MKEYETKQGLDKPLGQQFGDYLLHLIQGDLGFSYHNNDSVSNLLKKRISSTLMIAIPALILSSLLALVLGTIMGYRKNTKSDNGITTGFIVLDAVPTFLLAMMLVTVFCFQLWIFSFGRINFYQCFIQRLLLLLGPRLAFNFTYFNRNAGLHSQ